MAVRRWRSGLLDRRKFMEFSMVGVAGLPARGLVNVGDPLALVARTLKVDTVKRLAFEASGADFTVGQNFTPRDPWPRVAIKQLSATIDYETASMRVDLVREMGRTM